MSEDNLNSRPLPCSLFETEPLVCGYTCQVCLERLWGLCPHLPCHCRGSGITDTLYRQHNMVLSLQTQGLTLRAFPPSHLPSLLTPTVLSSNSPRAQLGGGALGKSNPTRFVGKGMKFLAPVLLPVGLQFW